MQIAYGTKVRNENYKHIKTRVLIPIVDNSNMQITLFTLRLRNSPN